MNSFSPRCTCGLYGSSNGGVRSTQPIVARLFLCMPLVRSMSLTHGCSALLVHAACALDERNPWLFGRKKIGWMNSTDCADSSDAPVCAGVRGVATA
jgi:hypothetical protein